MSEIHDPDADQAIHDPDSDHPGLANAAKAAGWGAAGAAGTWGAGRFLRWAFPALAPKRAFLGALNSALKKDFGGQGLEHHWPEYTRTVRDSGKPLTFADYLASKSLRAPETMSLLNKSLDESGRSNPIVEEIFKRGEGQRGRVLGDLARALGIPEKSLNQTTEELMKTKQGNAKTLYDEAFKNKSPLADSRVYDLFQKHEPIMEGALENAEEAFKYDPSKRIESQTLIPQDLEKVPDYLKVGQPKNGMQRVITPNVESLDRMKRALWNLQQKRASEGAGDVGAIIGARRDLTGLLDEIGPPEYQQARRQYAGDTALEEAADLGKNLFKQNPADLKMRLLGMSPDERTALARGFYGSLEGMNDTKFAREVVARNPAYAKHRELLSAVFPDNPSLDQFLKNLQGEEAMHTGQQKLARPGRAADTGGGPRIGAGAVIGHGIWPHSWIRDALPLPPYDPTGAVPRGGADMLFGKPDFSSGLTIPGGEPVSQFNRAWPHGARGVPSWTGTPGGLGWEVEAPGVVGGLSAGAAGISSYHQGEPPYQGGPPWWARH